MNDFSNLITVILFEYKNVVKRISFLVATVLTMLFFGALVFLPNIIGLFEGAFESDNNNEGTAVVIDSTGHFGTDMLSRYFPGYEWVVRDSAALEQVIEAVELREYEIAVYFTGLLEHTIISAATVGGVPHQAAIADMVKNEYRRVLLTEQSIGADSIESILYPVVSAEFLIVGGAGFIVAYLVSFLVYMNVLSAGTTIMSAVMKEKTSKTVELLFVSAKPSTIIVGKVLAAGLVMVTNAAFIAATVVVALMATGSAVLEFLSPQVLAMLADPIVYVYVIFFFLSAFITYAFLFAGLSATVRDMQEGSSLLSLPIYLCIAGLVLGISVAGNPDFISPTFVRIVSYIPFISPFVMVSRVTTSFVPTFEIIFIMGINLLAVIITAIISSKIYQLCIMLFGHKITFRFLATKMIKG
jgi:ABC-2 type transport system permease protein